MADYYIDTSGTSYCASCDKYFPTRGAREQHIQEPKYHHPRCGVCHRRFLNKNALRLHLEKSPHHHFCGTCEKVFDNYRGLVVHYTYASVHRDDSDDEDDDEELDSDDDEETSYARHSRYNSWLANDYDDEDRDPDEPYSYRPTHNRHWEDIKADNMYPRGLQDPNEYDLDDDEHEYYDLFDLEHPDDLGDPPFEFGQEEEEEDDDDAEEGEEFECPMCETASPGTVCATTCGHLFCASCIHAALKYTGECPACDEKNDIQNLRRVFLTAQ